MSDNICPNCEQYKDSDVCPNCGHSTAPFPWLELVLLIVVGVPAILVGACGTIATFMAPHPISLMFAAVGAGGYYIVHRLFNDAMKRHKGKRP